MSTLVAHNGAAVFGGAERWTVRLLRRLQERGHDVLLLCRDEVIHAEVEKRGVPARVVHLGGHASLHEAILFARVLARIRPEALLLTTFKKTWLGGMGARLARVPRVVARIGLDSDRPARSVFYRTAFTRWIDRVVVNADGLRAGVLTDVPALHPSRVVTIFNGAERLPPQGTPGALRRALGIPEDAYVVGAVSRLVSQKRLDRLLRAVHLQAGAVHCVLAGDGNRRDELRALASSLGLGDRVHFLGAREDVGDVLAALDLFVLTSRAEGMSNSVLEAMAGGVPVLSTRVSGAEETLGPLEDGQRPGLITDPSPEAISAAMTSMLADRPTLRRMGEAGMRRVAQRFDWEDKVRRWEAVLFSDSPELAHEGASSLLPVAQ